MVQSSSNISPRLPNLELDDLFSGISSAFITPSLSSPVVLANTGTNLAGSIVTVPHTSSQPSSTSLSSDALQLHNPPTQTQNAIPKESICLNSDIGSVLITTSPVINKSEFDLARQANDNNLRFTIMAPIEIKPKASEILFVYDDPLNVTALSYNPVYTIGFGQQFIHRTDFFVKSVEWYVRRASKQHFLVLSCTCVAATTTLEHKMKTCRVYVLVEDAAATIPENEKESVALLSEFGRPSRRLDQRKNHGLRQLSERNVDEVEMTSVGFPSKVPTAEHLSDQHQFIRKVNFTFQSFSLAELAILIDVVAKYCPYYDDILSLSLWLTTTVYSIIKQKTPLENMLETVTDGYGGVYSDLRCCRYESSLLRPNSRKQFPYYLRKFDEAMVKFGGTDIKKYKTFMANKKIGNLGKNAILTLRYKEDRL